MEKLVLLVSLIISYKPPQNGWTWFKACCRPKKKSGRTSDKKKKKQVRISKVFVGIYLEERRKSGKVLGYFKFRIRK
jgi:hypothetical protein